ncbi:MAG: enoyl-CoA hydratase [Rhizobiales bacterium PAR1]|nr:MAG: enoyl-CoA hydratase [Rhizobiales bacterium PAR1]
MNSDHQSCVLVERKERIGHIRLNRPKSLNTLDETLGRALLEAVTALTDDPAIRVIVLSGEGRSFMAGGDLAVFASDLAHAGETAGKLIDLFHGTMRRIATADQIVISAAQGPVAGGGFSLALGCDLCIAASDATFVSAYAQIATNPDGGGSWTATRLLGPKRALAFLISPERIKAAEALELGMINKVVAPEALMTEAFAMADQIANGPRAAIGTIKRLVRTAVTGSMDAQFDLEKAGFMANASGADFREGVTAFLARRPARFE